MTNSALNNIEHINACQNKTVDQLLDTVLTKVGYGTFHKKLLVSTFFIKKEKRGRVKRIEVIFSYYVDWAGLLIT